LKTNELQTTNIPVTSKSSTNTIRTTFSSKQTSKSATTNVLTDYLSSVSSKKLYETQSSSNAMTSISYGMNASNINDASYKTSKYNEDITTKKWNEDTTMDYIPTNTNVASLRIEKDPIATSTDFHQESTLDEVFTTKMALTSTIQPFSDTTKSLTTNSQGAIFDDSSTISTETLTKGNFLKFFSK